MFLKLHNINYILEECILLLDLINKNNLIIFSLMCCESSLIKSMHNLHLGTKAIFSQFSLVLHHCSASFVTIWMSQNIWSEIHLQRIFRSTIIIFACIHILLEAACKLKSNNNEEWFWEIKQKMGGMRQMEKRDVID